MSTSAIRRIIETWIERIDALWEPTSSDANARKMHALVQLRLTLARLGNHIAPSVYNVQCTMRLCFGRRLRPEAEYVGMSGVCVPASICPINVIAIVPQGETFDIGEFPTLVCNSFDMPCCRISLTIDDELLYNLHYHKDAIESVSLRKFLSLPCFPIVYPAVQLVAMFCIVCFF